MPEIKFEQPIFDQSAREGMPAEFIDPTSGNQPKNSFWRNRVILLVAILVVFTAALVTIALLRTKKPTGVQSDKVEVSIQGPATLSSGNEAQYVIVYTNGENTDLTGLTMEVFYPSNFKFSSSEPSSSSVAGQLFKLPVLRQGQQAEIKIRGKLTGKVDEQKEIRAKLHYQISGYNPEFTTEGSFKTGMTAPKLTLEITGPVEVANGQDADFTINYTNISGQDLENVAIHVTYPSGFKFTQANPPASKDNAVWNLGRVVMGSSGKIDVKGSFTGDPDQEKLVVGELGANINNSFASQITSSVAFKIVSSALTLKQTATPAESVSLGQQIVYKLDYGNFGTKGLTNAVITLTLDGPAIDFSQIHADNAIVAGNTYTWKSAILKDLALISPNQHGTITLTIPLKQTMTSNVKNQLIKGTATILTDQNDNPVRAADLEVKLISQLGIFVSAKVASGPYPMEVGQTTTYAVTLLVTNLSNDVSDAQVTASIPLAESAWANVVSPANEQGNITFDKNASKLRWKLGTIPAFSGKFSTARNVTFDLNVTPTTSEQASSQVILNDIQAVGTDTFVNQDIESTKLGQFRTSDAD